MTNFQEMSGQSKEEMAHFLSKIGVDCSFCPAKEDYACTQDDSCEEAWFKWLGQKINIMADYWE